VAVVVVDTAAAEKVASEGATRSPHTVRCFSRLAKLARGSGCRRAQGLLRPRRLDAERRLHRLKLLTKFGQGWIRTSEGVKPADLQSAPFGHFGTYPLVPRKAFRVDIARALRLASSLANARGFS
jgi:hypothetical protein